MSDFKDWQENVKAIRGLLKKPTEWDALSLTQRSYGDFLFAKHTGAVIESRPLFARMPGQDVPMAVYSSPVRR